MRLIILILAITFTGITLAQDETVRHYNEVIPDLGKNSKDIVIFYLFTEKAAKLQGVNWGWAEKYNVYMVKFANKIYGGGKKFMTVDEIASDVDFNDEQYRYVFMPVTFRGVEFGRFWPDTFGVIDMVTGELYEKNYWTQTSHSKECKSEIIFLEKCRLTNLGQ